VSGGEKGVTEILAGRIILEHTFGVKGRNLKKFEREGWKDFWVGI
jgi:hypothetical protein